MYIHKLLLLLLATVFLPFLFFFFFLLPPYQLFPSFSLSLSLITNSSPLINNIATHQQHQHINNIKGKNQAVTQTSQETTTEVPTCRVLFSA
jgi:hypothetical protein